MEKSRIVWTEEIQRQRSNSNSITISPRPICKMPAPLKPVMSKTEMKTRERWRNAEVDMWLKAEEEKGKFSDSQEGIFEMEL